MFTCSICDETFVGVDQDSIYTTRCGHVFHHRCLTEWLDRAHTCPHCRSAVTKNNLLKLFLQVDPNARVIWNRKTEEELNSLNEQLKTLGGREKYFVSTITSLETQLENVQAVNRTYNQSVQIAKLECELLKSKLRVLTNQLATININYKLLDDIKKNIETQFSLEKVKNKSLEKSLYELQCVNSVIIDKLKFEIADLKTEKAYFQSKCHNLENGNNCAVPSTSKEIIKKEPIPSHEIQIKNESFYGHDPQLNLSSKKFLLGCVFLIVEDFNQCEDICNDTSMSKLNIIEHGGSVEQVYSSRITHIVCGTQKNFNVEQGVQDGKRCITDFWLTDIISQKKMLPPWLAHHFPTPYSEEDLPCRQYQIVIANFDSNEYHKVKLIVELTGANVVNEVTSSVDIVVTLKFEGTLVETALALNVPVVNVQWLNDILCGAQIGLKNPKNNKYQHFDLFDPFAVNYDMVSHLMEAWKTPVIFLKNEEVYDLTKSPTNCKRKKTNDYPEVINLDDEDDNDDEAIIITYFKNKDQPKNPCVIFCGFTMTEQEELKLIVLQLGGKMATQYNDGTHLVMKEPLKTIPFLCCLSTINQIVNAQWLRDSQLISEFKDEVDYCFQEIFDGNTMVCNVPNVLANSRRSQLFKNLTFFVTPGIQSPPSTYIKEIIISAGGTIETILRSENAINSLPPNHYFIISCLEDACSIPDILEINHVIYSSDFVTNSVMKQSIDFKDNYLSISSNCNIMPILNI
ncbi:Zinc finger, RING-type,Zinc finger, RING/FYVE/PHD-type,BRCT domain [Cinara cedri]|uniref:PAX-interacting protein 1 n=1 Tax=Cinara cedri TaxID=506608 RepID=A0A5E4NEB3_9HEMI|nr:Zinc finger, RING-type,Zinc finger, RING/FYVE/PHD-type,BRCT domain [Cinara cedri]